MFTNGNANLAVASGLSRRSLIGFGLLTAATISLSKPALAAQAQTNPTATATIERFNQALLASMKAGGSADFSRRFKALAPAVDRAFDLQAVLARSVGPNWSNLSADERAKLLGAFRSYTVASYVANFDNYNGQKFSVSPDTRSVGAGQTVVQSQITPVSGDPHDLDYVMQETPAGWKIVDVLANGSISRVAVQRSDFRHLLAHGGGNALVASLQHKTSDLSGGALA